MRNLIIKFLGGNFLRFVLVSTFDTEWTLSFRLGSFQIIISVFSGAMWQLMGMCRLHIYYKKYYIFHWCDLCVVPRIKGVNL